MKGKTIMAQKLRYLSNEEKETIEKLYKEGVPSKKIAEQLGRTDQTVISYLNRTGLRTPKYSNKKICPNCRATTHQKGARFCFRCGSDIRSEEIVLSERVQRICQNIQLMPESVRSETSDTLQAVMDYFNSRS